MFSPSRKLATTLLLAHSAHIDVYAFVYLPMPLSLVRISIYIYYIYVYMLYFPVNDAEEISGMMEVFSDSGLLICLRTLVTLNLIQSPLEASKYLLIRK